MQDSAFAATDPGTEITQEVLARQAATSFPIAHWDRYEFLALLGTGGMGAVYKARDRQLDRVVAIKFIHGDNPALVRRFLQEAHAQARLDHPGLCRVYEVGRAEGKPYIAMQFVEGLPLDRARPELSLYDKVQIIRDAALALNEVHRLGIIHRDLKPVNIMVERLPDGSFRSVVMDFGLARESGENRGLTETGAVMGTPAYMPPEQARGNSRHLDRRADVYSLGATLYELLAGQPPFAGQEIVDVILAVLSDDPMPVRGLAPDVPVDLETIVLKCLAKEPGQRYDSMRALAEDLQRYIDGEPIQGKRSSVFYRLRRFVHKHQGLVVLGTAAALVTLALGGFGLRTELQARRRAQLAQQLGQDIKEFELFMRAAYSLPTHDIRREQAVLRQRMTQLRERLKDAGAGAEGAVRYALGRGHLVLREYGAAQAELERGWQAGYRTGEARLALGLALGERYRQELEQARRASDRKWVEAREKELEAQYLKPAVAYLEGAKTPLDAPAYIEGLLALYRKQHEFALNKAREAQAQAPWLSEPLKLEGDVYQELAVALMERGEYKAAVGKLKEAVDRHQAAALIGRSDSAIHEAEAADWLWLLATKEHTGEALGETAERATAACDRAMHANPTDASIYQTQASVHWRSAILALSQNQDPLGLVSKSIEASQRAVELDPDNWLSHYGIGVASGLLIQQQVRESALDDKTVEAATTALGAAVRLNPNAHWAWNDLAMVFMFRMIHEMQRGVFKKEFYDAFIAGAEKAVQLRPDDANPFANLSYGIGLVAAFHLESGLPPDPYIAQAIAYAKRGQAINPANMNHLNNETTGHLIAATFQILRGEDPAAELSTAERLISRSLELNPTYSETHQMATGIQYLRAWHALRAGRIPSAEISRGLLAAARGQAVSKDDATILLYKARLHGISGRAQRDEAALLQARAEAAQAVALTPKLPEAHEVKCEIFRFSATLRFGAPNHPPKGRAEGAAWIEQGLGACDTALALNPRRAMAHGHRGALRLLQAKGSRDLATRRERATAAAQDLKKSIELNRWLEPEFTPLLADAKQFQGSASPALP